MKYTFSLWIVLLYSLSSTAQIGSGLVGYYSFDNANTLDQTVNLNHGTPNGNLSYDCGVSGLGLRLQGEDQFVDFFGNLNTYFRGNANFSINFYFRSTDPFGTFDIVSKRETCDPNNYFAIRYNPASQSIIVELGENENRLITARQRLNPNQCWHMITMTKDRNTLRVYADTEEIFSESFTGIFETNNTAPFSIANSPCVGITDRRFIGMIDELRVYNRAINPSDIQNLYLFPEKIIPRDTVIYKGFEFTPRAGNSCAEIVEWNPATGVTPPDAWNPVLAPLDTTVYLVTNILEGCISTDTLTVIVIDPETVPCNTIPMANAFSPNNDGINDTYGISNPFSLTQLISFQIFDRWGTTLFQTSDPFQQWDGTFRGQLLDPNSYVYRIVFVCEGKEIVQNGELLLFR
jgi:gliding motility-associated-like protein